MLFGMTEWGHVETLRRTIAKLLNHLKLYSLKNTFKTKFCQKLFVDLREALQKLPEILGDMFSLVVCHLCELLRTTTKETTPQWGTMLVTNMFVTQKTAKKSDGYFGAKENTRNTKCGKSINKKVMQREDEVGLE